MVSFVVEHQDALHAHELGHHSLQHLTLGLASIERQAPSLKKQSASLRDLDSFPAPEGVVVGDDNLRAVQSGQQVDRNQLTVAVVAVRVVRLQYPQPVLDGQAGRNDQESAGESTALRTTHRVDGLPRNQHGHHHGLAGTGGQLEREAPQTWIRLLARVVQVLEESPAGTLQLGGDLGKPDDGLDRFDLTEERSDVAESVVPPVLEQALRLGSHPPPVRVRLKAPVVDLADGRC